MRLALSDLKVAFRGLYRSPLFALVVVASLALGIGANTAIFTLIDQLMLRLLPVRDPQQLVMVWTTGPVLGINRGLRASSYPMHQAFQKNAPAFSDVFCRYLTPLSVSIDGRTERVNAELVSGNYFQVLGVAPALGRLFTSDQDDRQYKGHPVVVLSYQYWRNRFAGDPAAVGKKILVNGYPMDIVGVSAANFPGLDPSLSPQIRIPIQMKPLMTPGWDDMGNRRSQWVEIFARVKHGYTLQSARASSQTLLAQILQDELTDPALNNISPVQRQRFLNRKIEMEVASSGYSDLRQSYSSALVVLMCMVGAVLLIACFNVANLLIARGMARQKDTAVRLALGASRWQLLRSLLVESLMLSLAGGLVGLGFSIVATRVLLNLLPSDGTPLFLHAAPDARILAFNVGLSLLTGLLFGLAPAWQGLQLNHWNTLRDAGGAVAGGSGSATLRKSLVVAQVTFSFLLVVAAALFAKTLTNLRHTNPSFSDSNHLITFQLDPGLNGYSTPRLKAFYQQVLEGMHGLPGVQSSGFAMIPLLSGDQWNSAMSATGYQGKDGEDLQVYVNGVSPGFCSTMGLTLLEGRDFDARDRGKKITVAIVNKKFAQYFFGNASPIGRFIGFGRGSSVKFDIEIIGLVQDSLYDGPREGVHRQVLVPFSQIDLPSSAAFYVRTSDTSDAFFKEVRGKVSELDPAIPIYAVKTLDGQLDETLSTERLIALLSASFGLFAAVLAATGLYAVLSFVVARRTREIGLRIAVGAQRGQILWMIMKEVFLLLGIGLAAGVPSAYFLSRYVSSQLFGVRPTDIGSAVFAVLALSLAAVGAGFAPALRASTMSPTIALRYE